MSKPFPLYCKLEYVSMDTEGNIILGISKRTYGEEAIKLLKEFEGEEVYILVARGKWDEE